MVGIYNFLDSRRKTPSIRESECQHRPLEEEHLTDDGEQGKDIRPKE